MMGITSVWISSFGVFSKMMWRFSSSVTDAWMDFGHENMHLGAELKVSGAVRLNRAHTQERMWCSDSAMREANIILTCRREVRKRRYLAMRNYSPFFLSWDLTPRYSLKTARNYLMNFSKRLLVPKKRSFAQRLVKINQNSGSPIR